jgi:hypothetical protein
LLTGCRPPATSTNTHAASKVLLLADAIGVRKKEVSAAAAVLWYGA